MIKKIIIGLVILVVIGVAVLILVPWGEYESKLEKSEIETEEIIDSTGNTIPSLSLIQGLYTTTINQTQAELLFDVDGLKKTKGAFERFTIDFKIEDAYHLSTLTVAIESASLNTGNTMRDEHLLEPDFFDVENHPTINFIADLIEDTDTGYVAKGALTLLDNTKPIDVPFKHLGNGMNQDGQAFEAFEGGFVFDRVAYGMEEVSGAGNIVTIEFYCELMLSE